MFDFLIKINGKEDLNLTQHLSQICLTDESGTIDDELSLDFILNNDLMPLHLDDSLSISFGNKNDLIEWSSYRVSGLEVRENILSVRSYASDEIPSLKKKRTIHWEAGISQIINKIAKDAGAELIFDKKFSTDTIKIFQDESDLSFLHRLSGKYNAILKINNKKIVFVTRDHSSLPRFYLHKPFPYTWNKGKKYSGVKAHFWDADNFKQSYILIGEEGNVASLPGVFSSLQKARNRASAHLMELKNEDETLKITVPCTKELNTAKISCGSELEIKVFPTFANGLWSIRRVEHRMNADHGLLAELDCRRLAMS